VKVNLDIRLVPELCKVTGRKTMDFEFQGETVGDMVRAFVEKYGPKAREALYSRNNQLDEMIQVILNSEKWISSEKLKTTLKQDDSVSLMLLIAGG
jgi:molybdopterin converting factor small subunit